MRYCGNCARFLEDQPGVSSNPTIPPAPLLNSLENQVELESAQRFHHAGLALQGQHRRVAILFADLSHYTRLSEQIEGDSLYELVQDLMKQLVDSVYQYEGLVDKILGDGIMAIFGAPAALENPAERAVRAALEMQSRVQKINQKNQNRLGLDLNLHIGINEGFVIVGPIGSDQRVDYTAIGETVNLADRLLEAAGENQILVSEAIYSATKSLFEFKGPARIQAKGYQKPVLAYRFVVEKKHPGLIRGIEGLSAPMIGRQPELRLLIECADNLIKTKKSQFVLVTGEAGIGKSRLKSEFIKQLEPQTFFVCEGQSLTYRRSVPYWIFKSLLNDLLGIPPKTQPAQIHAKLTTTVRQHMGKDGEEILPFLEHLLFEEQDDLETHDHLSYLEPEKVREGIFQSLREFLLAEARQQPLVIILEDLHWADDSSLDLLTYLVESIHLSPILICALSRPELDHRLKKLVLPEGNSHNCACLHIQLNYLSPDQSEQLFSELLKIPEFPEYFRQLVLKRAEGIPFYLEEILRMLIDEGVIELREGHWRMVSPAEISALRVPGNLQNLILARIDKLAAVHRKVLQVASVIGTEFNTSILSLGLSEIAESKLREILEELENRAFIVPTSLESSGYQFRHALTADGVYSTLLKREREAIHGRVADAIVSHYEGNLEGQVEILAGHYLRSAYLDKALYYLLLAGKKAAREYANQQSRQHFSEAAALLPRVQHTPEQARQVWSGFGDVLTFMGDYPNARLKYQEALNLSAEKVVGEDNLPVFREFCNLNQKIATTYERQGEFSLALQHLEAARRLLDQSVIPSPYEKASIYNSTGWIFFLQGRFGEARSTLSTALKIIEGSNHFDLLASIHNRLGAVAYQERSYFESEIHVSESLRLRERMNDRSGVARLYNNLGLLGLMRGNLRMAEENFVQSSSLLEKTGDAEGVALSNINLGLVKIDRGDLESAGTYLAKAIQAAKQIGHRYYLALALMYIGRINSEIGEYAAAESSIQESLGIFTELGSTDGRIDAIYYLAENFLACMDLEKASTFAVMTQEELDRSGPEIRVKEVQNGRLLRLLGKLARVRRNYSEAKLMLEQSDRIFAQSSEKLELGRTYLELGLLAKSQNFLSQARGYFQQASLIFDQIGAERDLRQVNLELNHFRQ